jgi:hypothetical protein
MAQESRQPLPLKSSEENHQADHPETLAAMVVGFMLLHVTSTSRENASPSKT